MRHLKHILSLSVLTSTMAHDIKAEYKFQGPKMLTTIDLKRFDFVCKSQEKNKTYDLKCNVHILL